MTVLAIDPGLHGALALLLDDGQLLVEDMPILTVIRAGKERNEIDLQGLRRLLTSWAAHRPQAWVEQVGPQPGNGAVQAFAYGKGYGALLAVLACCDIPVSHVTPVVWKKAMGLNASKDGSRLRASELLPEHATTWQRKKDDGRAEAALLALYGRKKAA